MGSVFPQVYLIYALLTVLVLGGVYVKGRVDGREICNNRIAVIQAESVDRERKAHARAAEASAELEAARGRIEIKYRTITKEIEKIVDRPVYSHLCFDADGLRLANAALRPEVAGKSPDNLPEPTAP